MLIRDEQNTYRYAEVRGKVTGATPERQTFIGQSKGVAD